MPKMSPLAKVVVPVAIGCASLCMYSMDDAKVASALPFTYQIAKIEMNIVNKSDIPEKIKNIKYAIGQTLVNLISKSSLRRNIVDPHNDTFTGSSNLDEMVDYAGRLGVSPNAMPLDDVVNILNKEYSTLWPEHPVDEKYFLAVMSAESGFNPKAYNPSSGATGLSQFLRSSWRKNSNKSFRYATDPEENIKALITMTRKNLDHLQGHYPNWDNQTELVQYVQLGLEHLAGAGTMEKAKFNPYRIKDDDIRAQAISYQAVLKDYLTK